MTPGEISGLSRFRGISREQCGLVVKERSGRLSVIRVKNSSSDPERYEITEDEFAWVASLLPEGARIFAILHTHLAHHPLEPSADDWEGAKHNPGWLHAIYKPSTGEITWYVYEAD